MPSVARESTRIRQSFLREYSHVFTLWILWILRILPFLLMTRAFGDGKVCWPRTVMLQQRRSLRPGVCHVLWPRHRLTIAFYTATEFDWRSYIMLKYVEIMLHSSRLRSIGSDWFGTTLEFQATESFKLRLEGAGRSIHCSQRRRTAKELWPGQNWATRCMNKCQARRSIRGRTAQAVAEEWMDWIDCLLEWDEGNFLSLIDTVWLDVYISYNILYIIYLYFYMILYI